MNRTKNDIKGWNSFFTKWKSRQLHKKLSATNKDISTYYLKFIIVSKRIPTHLK